MKTKQTPFFGIAARLAGILGVTALMLPLAFTACPQTTEETKPKCEYPDGTEHYTPCNCEAQ